jgi:K+-transporting ATPase KdpF subunit
VTVVNLVGLVLAVGLGGLMLFALLFPERF